MTLISAGKDSPILIVISTPNSSRGDQLKSQLNDFCGFRVIILNAIMLNDYSQVPDTDTDPRRMSKILLRKVLPSEIGCSMSHNLAREMIAGDTVGGIILEDDAEVKSLQELLEISSLFLQIQENEPSVLSLTTSVTERNFENKKGKPPKFYRLSGTPALAQSYVLTPVAAKMLLDANSPVNYLADWPYSRANFFISNKIISGNPTQIPISTIDPQGIGRAQSLIVFYKKIFVYTGLYYLFNLLYFDSPYSYFKAMVLTRVRHHFDSLLVRFYKLREFFS